MTTLVMSGDINLRHRGFFAASRKRFAERGFPDDTGFCQLSGSKPGDNGLVGGDAS